MKYQINLLHQIFVSIRLKLMIYLYFFFVTYIFYSFCHTNLFSHFCYFFFVVNYDIFKFRSIFVALLWKKKCLQFKKENKKVKKLAYFLRKKRGRYGVSFLKNKKGFLFCSPSLSYK